MPLTCSNSFALNCSSVAITGTRETFSGDWSGNDMYCEGTSECGLMLDQFYFTQEMRNLLKCEIDQREYCTCSTMFFR